jgi:hypothetical protein
VGIAQGASYKEEVVDLSEYEDDKFMIDGESLTDFAKLLMKSNYDLYIYIYLYSLVQYCELLHYCPQTYLVLRL